MTTMVSLLARARAREPHAHETRDENISARDSRYISFMQNRIDRSTFQFSCKFRGDRVSLSLSLVLPAFVPARDHYDV